MSKSAFDNFLSTAGSMAVINLPNRRDRHREFATQLKTVGSSFDHPMINVFEAIRPDDAAGFPNVGARGCFLSHLGVLRNALASGQDRVLICEDDLNFASDIVQLLPNITSELEREAWSIFYGGYGSPISGEPAALGVIQADPEHSIMCCHFYAIRGPALLDLVSYLEAILARPPGHPDGGPMHVDGAISRFRSDFPHYITLAATPPIGFQRSSRTDIHKNRWFDRLPIVRGGVGVFRHLANKAR
jgi:hypothetical protein